MKGRCIYKFWIDANEIRNYRSILGVWIFREFFFLRKQHILGMWMNLVHWNVSACFIYRWCNFSKITLQVSMNHTQVTPRYIWVIHEGRIWVVADDKLNKLYRWLRDQRATCRSIYEICASHVSFVSCASVGKQETRVIKNALHNRNFLSHKNQSIHLRKFYPILNLQGLHSRGK